MLLAGKPILQLPLVLEQRLTADATVRLGAGERAEAGDAQSVRPKLDALLTDEKYARAARAFAARHGDFDPQAQVRRMAGRVEELLEELLETFVPRPAARAGGGLAARATAGVFSG